MKTLVWVALLAGGQVKAVAMGCAPTPRAAVQQMVSGGHAGGDADGFRVHSVHVDALRKQGWALVEQCGKVGLPMIAVRVPQDSSVMADMAAERVPVVHIGDEVTVLVRRDSSQMVLHGWAEESGVVAGKVRVRLPRLSEDESAAAPKINCRVTRAGVVEVIE